MRCVECGHDSTKGERGGLNRCPKCHRDFAFSPDEAMSDLAFQSAIRAVSEDGRLAWSKRHLYYELAGWMRRRMWAVRLTRRPIVRLEWSRFEDMFERWRHVHGEPPGQVAAGVYAEPPVEAPAPDVADYSFDSVVVCGREEIVDFLLANSFHTENRAPVFSAGGYPNHVYEKVIPRLRSELPRAVIVLHDADSEGCALAARVAEDPRWFANREDVPVVDAGLRPADTKPFRGAFLAGSPLDTGGGDDQAERKWLTKYRLELEALRPRSVFLRLATVVRTPFGTEVSEEAADSSDRIFVWNGLWEGAEPQGSDDYAG